MIWYEVIEDLGDGDSLARRFHTYDEAVEYQELNTDWCYSDIRTVDTDSDNFFHTY